MRPNKSTKKKYTDKEYDYESLYDTPINQLEEKEIENLLKTNSIDHHYVAKTIRSNKGGGNQIIIHHLINGRYYTSYYCHLSAFNVSVGQIVTKDTVIGKSGNTGNSTGPHLHLGLANGRWYADYYSYYGNNGFIGHSFNPRNAIVFPSKGSSYSNR